MQFPYYLFPWLGDGLVIAIVAIFHVFISHGVAIGMLTMIVIAEHVAHRRGDPVWEDFARSALKPAVIIITGMGAMTGAGIWFITSALVPAAIGSMLRVFFWPWFIEWLVFVAEVVVVLVYYFTWPSEQEPGKRAHLRLGVIYVALASVSAFLITGILGFMLTPDGWPSDRGFWGAFFNSTFLPQLAWRFSISFVMGAMFIIFYAVFSRNHPPDWRRQVLRLYAKVLLIPALLMPVCGWWWFTQVPDAFKTHAKPSLMMWAFAMNADWFWGAHIVAGVLVILLMIAAWRRELTATRILIVPAVLTVLFFVSEFERVREFMRGPYLMPGYMYANEVLVTEHYLYGKDGMLPYADWFHRMAPEPTPDQEGAFLLARNCGTCHGIRGKNNICDRFRGRTESGIYVVLGRTEEMVPWMPPFSGSDAERAKLAKFIQLLVDSPVPPQEPAHYPPLETPER